MLRLVLRVVWNKFNFSRENGWYDITDISLKFKLTFSVTLSNLAWIFYYKPLLQQERSTWCKQSQELSKSVHFSFFPFPWHTDTGYIFQTLSSISFWKLLESMSLENYPESPSFLLHVDNHSLLFLARRRLHPLFCPIIRGLLGSELVRNSLISLGLGSIRRFHFLVLGPSYSGS